MASLWPWGNGGFPPGSSPVRAGDHRTELGPHAWQWPRVWFLLWSLLKMPLGFKWVISILCLRRRRCTEEDLRTGQQGCQHAPDYPRNPGASTGAPGRQSLLTFTSRSGLVGRLDHGTCWNGDFQDAHSASLLFSALQLSGLASSCRRFPLQSPSSSVLDGESDLVTCPLSGQPPRRPVAGTAFGPP